MKNVILTTVMLIVLSIAGSVNAQNQVSMSLVSGPYGSEMLRCENNHCKSDNIHENRRLVAIVTDNTPFAFRNKEYGFEDSEGKLVIPYQFIEAAPFSEGVAAVMMKCTKNPCMYHIKPDGTPLYTKRFTEVFSFVNGYAKVEEKGRYDIYHIDKNGNRIYPQTYKDVSAFTDSGYAMAMKESMLSSAGVPLWVLINTKGQELLSYRGDRAQAEEYFAQSGYL